MRFLFGDHVLDTARRELRHGGTQIALEPQVFDLLVYLLQNRERVVGKDDLLASVWGGRIVSDATLDSRIAAARRAVGDSGGAQTLIRTFARKGVRFIAEVREEGKSAAFASEMAAEPRRAELALPDNPSIAVLPFTNMSSDPEQEFFAHGIADDVITALSHYPSLFVIARNSSFTYKGPGIDVKEIGRDLGVRYVLEGSLRKGGNRIRVTAQLVEAEAGRHVWAERFDRDLTDIFAVQDEITEAVTIAIAPAIADAELHRALRKPPESLDAWAAYQRGLWHLEKGTAEHNGLAEKFFRQAVDLDSNFADGYRGLATAKLRTAISFRIGSLVEAQRFAERMAHLAIALNGNNPFAHSCLSFALLGRGDHRGALAEAERALALSPNLASGYFERGAALIYSGRPQEGLRDLQKNLKLEPRGPNLPTSLHLVAIGLYFSRAYDEAILAIEHLIRAFPEYPSSYRWLAAALGQSGCVEGARETLGKAMAIAPAPFVRPRAPWWRPEDYAHFLEGLRKAGWEG